MKRAQKYRKICEIFIHLIVWSILMLFPFFTIDRDLGHEPLDFWRAFTSSILPISFLFLFYLNYFFIIPKVLLSRAVRNWPKFIMVNLLIVISLSSFFHLYLIPQILIPANLIFHRGHHLHPTPLTFDIIHTLLFLLRDSLSFLFIIGLAVSIKFSLLYGNMEMKLKEIEKLRSEMELNNLRNQLNPHFLLNTLNNIYALIVFDEQKAQSAVRSLSRLLHSILYEKKDEFVPLYSEVEFINNYVELMCLRVTENVNVQTHYDLQPNSKAVIAPMIFISLIENAFKHGISYIAPSFITISIVEELGGRIICKITNSYHPKDVSDKSGSGVGLDQVQKRLDTMYSGHYEWNRTISPDGKIYESEIVINNN